MLFDKHSSLAIGAGDVGCAVVELGEHTKSLRHGEHFLLRWKFDVTPESMSVDFSILKGKYEDASKLYRPDYLVAER
jgi:hypothetical protein